jgi:hypothetical protein
MAKASFEDRFWAKVTKTETCWNWTGGTDSSGYGVTWRDRRFVGAHRASYELRNKAIADGLVVDHICHNRACVNPDHLRLATSKQNMENLSKLMGTNKSGVRGVFWSNTLGKWQARVTHHGRRVHVGLFEDLRDAEAAVILKRNELFTHNDLDRVA